MFDQVDAMAGTLVGWIASAFFFPIYTSSSGTEIPLVVAWLVVGAIFFTIRMGFINFRGFKHAIDVVRGKYDNPDAEGEVSHFKRSPLRFRRRLAWVTSPAWPSPSA